MRKILTTLLLVSLLLTSVACSKKTVKPDDNNPVIVNPEVPGDTDETPEKPIEDTTDPVIVKPVIPVLVKPVDKEKQETDAQGNVYRVITRWVNGTYTASEATADSYGYRGTISVTLVDGRITAVFFDEITKAGTSKRNDASYNTSFKNLYGFTIADAISVLERRLIAKQNPNNVDAITSATITTDRFIRLAVNALRSAPIETIRILVKPGAPVEENPVTNPGSGNNDEKDDDLDLVIEKPKDDVVTAPTGDGDWEEDPVVVVPPVENPANPTPTPTEPPVPGASKLVAYGQPYKVRVVGNTDSRGYFPVFEVSVSADGTITKVYFDESTAAGVLKSTNASYYPAFVAANNMTVGELFKTYEDHFMSTGVVEGIDVTAGATRTHGYFLMLAQKAMKLLPTVQLTVYGNPVSNYTPQMTITIGEDGKLLDVFYDEIHVTSGASKVESLNSPTPYFSQLLTRAFIKLDEIFKIYQFKFKHQANFDAVDTVTNATRVTTAFNLLTSQITRMVTLSPSAHVVAKLPTYGEPYTIKATGSEVDGWTPFLTVSVSKDGTIRSVVFDEINSSGELRTNTLTTGSVTPTVFSGYRLAYNYYADYFKRYGTLVGIDQYTTVPSMTHLHQSFSLLASQVVTPSANVEITVTKDVASTAWRPELKVQIDQAGTLTYAFFNEYRDGRLSKVEDPNYYPQMKDRNPDGYTIQQVFKLYDAYLVEHGNVDDIDVVSGATSLHTTYTGFVEVLKEMVLNRLQPALPESIEPEVVAVEPEEGNENPIE